MILYRKQTTRKSTYFNQIILKHPTVIPNLPSRGCLLDCYWTAKLTPPYVQVVCCPQMGSALRTYSGLEVERQRTTTPRRVRTTAKLCVCLPLAVACGLCDLRLLVRGQNTRWCFFCHMIRYLVPGTRYTAWRWSKVSEPVLWLTYGLEFRCGPWRWSLARTTTALDFVENCNDNGIINSTYIKQVGRRAGRRKVMPSAGETRSKLPSGRLAVFLFVFFFWVDAMRAAPLRTPQKRLYATGACSRALRTSSTT